MNNNNLIQIAKQVELEKVLSYCKIKVTKSGQFCCPFHNDSKPSAIKTANNKGCCLACDKVNGKHFTFDTIDLVMIVDGVDFKTAVKTLVELEGQHIEYTQMKCYEIKANKDSSAEVNNMIQFCRKMTMYQVNYLANRGIYLNDNKYYTGIKEILIKNNIAIYHNYYGNCNKIVYHFKHNEDNCPYYEDFNEEFMIIKKTEKFDDYNTPKAQNIGTPHPKFIFTNERELEIYICEGIEDALSMVQAGRNAITLNSVNNVDKLIEIFEDAPKLAKYKFIIATDMDKAGLNCKNTLIEYFEENGFKYDTFKPLEIMFEQQGIKDVNDLWKLKLGLKK